MELEYSVPECPVCYTSYDNVFKTPLLLPCSHTFCMECLSKLCVHQKELETFCCPVCRATVTIPPGGIPQLPPNMNIVSRFPPWMRELQKVWMEDSKLCWKQRYGHNYITRTPNTVSHYPPRQEENMVISIYLLSPAPTRSSQSADLVMVPPRPRQICCDSSIQMCSCVACVLVFSFAVLFFMIFVLPMNMHH